LTIIFDPNKSEINFCKHGIRFSDAESVLFDPMALTRENGAAEGEQRFVSIGMNEQENFSLSSLHTAAKKFV